MPQRTPGSGVVAAIVAASLLGGCALFTAPPDVQVARVAFRGGDLLDQAFTVDLCAYNPNDRTLAFQRVDAAVDIAGAPFAAGVSNAPVLLPPHQSVLVPFSVSTTTGNMIPQVLGILRTGAVSYRVHGHVMAGEQGGFIVPFQRSGRFDLTTSGSQLIADAGPPAADRCGSE